MSEFTADHRKTVLAMVDGAEREVEHYRRVLGSSFRGAAWHPDGGWQATRELVRWTRKYRGLRALLADRDELEAEPKMPKTAVGKLVTDQQRLLEEREAEVERLKAFHKATMNVSESYMPGKAPHDVIHIQGQQVERLEAEVERLKAALRWALGEGETFKAREPGDGPYWWRNELRLRANLPVKALKGKP